MLPRCLIGLGSIGARRKEIIMQTMTKNVLLILVGAVLGGTGTYLVCKKNYDKLMNEETKSIGEYYEKYYSDRIEELQDKIIDMDLERRGINVPEKKEEETVEKPKKKVKKENLEPVEAREYENIVKTNYNAISTELHHAEPEDPVIEKPVTSKKKAKKKTVETKGPEIITFDDYTHDRRFEKRIITYLDQEDMFLDGITNEPIEDAEKLVGDECIDLHFSEDGESVYVRNESIGTDFEIVINVTDTYQEFCAT